MRVAWPELVVLVVVSASLVFGVEIGALVLVSNAHVSIWIDILLLAAMAVLDLWAAFRMIDWLFAGPARRQNLKIVRRP